MTIPNPYETTEPFIWAADYLLFRGRVVAMIKYNPSDRSERWYGYVFCDETTGKLIRNPAGPAMHSPSRAGVMLRVQDWLEDAISRRIGQLEKFLQTY